MAPCHGIHETQDGERRVGIRFEIGRVGWVLHPSGGYMSPRCRNAVAKSDARLVNAFTKPPLLGSLRRKSQNEPRCEATKSSQPPNIHAGDFSPRAQDFGVTILSL